MGWRLAVAAGLLVPSTAWSDEATVEVDPQQAAAQQATQPADGQQTLSESKQPFSEDSVLVATRQAADAAISDLPPAETSLKPVSRYPQEQPVLADPLSEFAPPLPVKPMTSSPPPAKLAANQPIAVSGAPVSGAPVETNSAASGTCANEAAAAELATELAAEPNEAAPQPANITPIVSSAAAVAPPQDEPAPLTAAPLTTAADDQQAATASEVKPRAASTAASTPGTVDATDVARAYAANTKLEAARFHGIVPGVSTGTELAEAWGPAKETSPTETGQVLSYDMPPFAAVDVLIENDLVALIKVELESQQQPERLARRLRMDKIQAVEILDESGQSIVGLAYPEKGMLLLLATLPESAPPSTPQFVTHMVIQPLDAEAFALRADQAPYNAFETKLSDLRQALRLDADNAYANWQLAKLYRLSGKPERAQESAAAALKAAPTNDAYRLALAECLTERGDYDQAVLESRNVLDSDSAPSVVKAGALHLMGRLASLGDSNIAEKAIGFHTMAIDVADKLATSTDRNERHTAKRILIDSHLAVAREISRRKYARKTEIVAQWIGRASGLAEQMITDDGGSLELRLVVAREALAALANLNPTKDPAPWIKEAEQSASELLADCRDPMFRSRVEWQLGEAYFHALRIEHGRKRVEAGIAFGKQSLEHLTAGAVGAETRPAAELLVGRLYFHMGAIHAVHRQDHAKAVGWYNRAQPLLAGGQSGSELAVPRRQGEALVSMAVSYWDQGQREKAVELTDSGAELMERAVAGGVLDETALAVPYGNLATMHKKLGDRNASAKFAKLARGARGSAVADIAPAVRPKVEQATKPQRQNQAVRQQRRPQTSRSASNPGRRSSASTQRSSQSSSARTAARQTRNTASGGGQKSGARSANNASAQSNASNAQRSRSQAQAAAQAAAQSSQANQQPSNSRKPSRLRRTTPRSFLR